MMHALQSQEREPFYSCALYIYDAAQVHKTSPITGNARNKCVKIKSICLKSRTEMGLQS